MKLFHLLVIAIAVATLDVLVPYIFLQEVTAYWANYLFWTMLTLTVILGGIYYVRRWGENE